MIQTKIASEYLKCNAWRFWWEYINENKMPSGVQTKKYDADWREKIGETDSLDRWEKVSH